MVIVGVRAARGNEFGVLIAQSGSCEASGCDCLLTRIATLALEIRMLVPFIQMTERTTTHDYPREEIRAMMDFYDGKTCVLTHNQLTVHWAHMLDAALSTSHQRVQHTF